MHSPDEATGTEKQKMLAGKLYLASGPELTAERLHAQTLLHRFNQSSPADSPTRTVLLGDLLGHMGENVTIQPRFRCDYGYNISIGAGTFINFDCVFLDCSRITLGREVQVAPGVHLYTATHPLDPALRRSGLELALPITVGDNVWLGGGCILCPGVTVGENTVIGAGSVVIRDLPPNVVAAGNPARIRRQLS